MLKKVFRLPAVAFFFFTFMFAGNGFVQASSEWVLFCSALSGRGSFTGGVEYLFVGTKDNVYTVNFYGENNRQENAREADILLCHPVTRLPTVAGSTVWRIYRKV